MTRTARDPAQKAPPAKTGPLGRPVAGWITLVLLAAVLTFSMWLWRHVRIGVIASDSMAPTLVKGDLYAIRIDAYRDSRPARGDIVVFKVPGERQLFVKRVVAVEGDRVAVVFGRVWLDGRWLQEPYINHRPGVREHPMGTVVPPGELFVLGDNRNMSEDSRDLGTIPVTSVVGRATAIILPLRRRGPLTTPDT